jgi:hypothetical protein
LKLVLGIDGGLELALAVLSEVDLLRLNDIVGGDVLLLDVSQIGLNAHRVVAQLADEVVT